MGPLRPVRGTVLVSVVALVASAIALVFAGPVAGSVISKPVQVRSDAAQMQDLAQRTQAAYDAYFDSTLLVFGDSISARFNDRSGDELQGFWSMVGDAVDARPQVYAEGGAGFVNPGLEGCSGHTLRQRLTDPEVKQFIRQAGAVIVEAGRTDTQTCAADGGYDLVPHDKLWWAANDFFARFSRLRGPDGACTFVLVPWGPAGLAENRERVVGAVSSIAESYGLTFVDTSGVLTEATTIQDQVHPTAAGNRALADRVLDSGAAASCFA